MRASGTDRPAAGRTVAMRRPGCTAGFGALTSSSPRKSTASSIDGTVNTRPPNRAGPPDGSGSGPATSLEHDLSHPEERLTHRHAVAFGVARPSERQAEQALDRARRTFDVGRQHHQVVDRLGADEVRGRQTSEGGRLAVRGQQAVHIRDRLVGGAGQRPTDDATRSRCAGRNGAARGRHGRHARRRRRARSSATRQDRRRCRDLRSSSSPRDPTRRAPIAT